MSQSMKTAPKAKGKHGFRRLTGIVAVVMSVMLLGALAGCAQSSSSTSASSTSSNAASASSSSSAPAEKTNVNVAALKGPTAIGISKFMADAASDDFKSSNAYNFTISGTADEVVPGIIKGDFDIALVPANVASTIYNKTEGGISVIDINTMGVLYVVSSSDEITDIADLAGKTVYMTGKGTTPEYVMNYLLQSAGIADQVTLEFKSQADEVVAVMSSDPEAIGVLPEPYVTATTTKNPDFKRNINLKDAWDALQNDGSQLVTGVTIVRNEFLKDHPEVVNEFIAKQAESVDYMNANPAESGQYVADAGIIENAGMASKAIPNCSLVTVTGEQMKSELGGYLNALYQQEPSSIGGALPGDDFYYEAE